MRIVIINAKSDFSSQQIALLETIGEVTFVEEVPNYTDTVFTDGEEKIIALGPEVVDWKVSNNDINKVTNLKAICLPTTSYSWVDGAFLKSKEIVLTNVPKYSTESVAEYAIWMMLSLSKKIPLIVKNEWGLDYAIHMGTEVRGKVMGVVGLGAIGTRIAEIGKAMGMNVMYWSRSSLDNRFDRRELDELMKESDFVFPTLAKNSETIHILNSEKINSMKADAYIVSVTGDELFDLPYAITQVESGEIAGLAVESEEKKITDYNGNVLVTPPIAWYTKEAVAEDMRIWIESVRSCVQKTPINVVN